MLRREPAKLGASAAHLDLLHDGVAVGVDELDRIFDGDDVIAAVGVDEIDQRGQRGAFAAAGGAGDQDQALARFGEAAKAGREVERFERGDFFRKQAGGCRQASRAGSGRWRGSGRCLRG